MAAVFKRLLLAFVLLTPVLGTSRPQSGPVNSILDVREFVDDWKISKQFTLDVANAMPADSYGFNPNSDEMTFGEQMVHIAVSNALRFHQITGTAPPFPIDLSKPTPSDKASALKMLEQSFDYVIAVIPQISPEQLKRTWHIPSWKGRTDPDGRAMVLNMFVHTAHHRAQCEVYLRAKGIKPPDYAF